jgi:hypothetical protein
MSAGNGMMNALEHDSYMILAANRIIIMGIIAAAVCTAIVVLLP